VKSFPIRCGITLVYLLLLTLAIPWYWPTGDVRHIFGLPLWVLTTLGAVFATSVITACIYLLSADSDTD